MPEEVYKVVRKVDEIATHCPKCGKPLQGCFSKDISSYFVYCKSWGCLWAEYYFLMR
jgi:hypothetical protein